MSPSRFIEGVIIKSIKPVGGQGLYIYHGLP